MDVVVLILTKTDYFTVEFTTSSTSRISAAPNPRIPKPILVNELYSRRETLPIHKYRSEIVKSVFRSRLTIIQGGKTSTICIFFAKRESSIVMTDMTHCRCELRESYSSSPIHTGRWPKLK